MDLAVVSYRGTWIETFYRVPLRTLWKSYLIEVRGLKPLCNDLSSPHNQSYLIEVRGLKQIEGANLKFDLKVVSYRGTWIETALFRMISTCMNVVSYRGTWIETLVE